MNDKLLTHLHSFLFTASKCLRASALVVALGATGLVGCADAGPDDAVSEDALEDEEEALDEEGNPTLEARVVGVSRDTSPRGRSGSPQVGSVTRTVHDTSRSSRGGVGRVTRTTHDTGSSSRGRTSHDTGGSSRDGSGRTVRFGDATRR